MALLEPYIAKLPRQVPFARERQVAIRMVAVLDDELNRRPEVQDLLVRRPLAVGDHSAVQFRPGRVERTPQPGDCLLLTSRSASAST